MFRDDYDNYYSVEQLGKEFARDDQVERVGRMLLDCEGSILDVGAGTGNLMKKAYFAGHKVEGVEIAPHLINYLRGLSLDVRNADARKLPHADKSFDTVTLGEIIEHLPNPGEALKEAFRVARKRVIFSVPLGNLNEDWHYWDIKVEKLRNFAIVTFVKKNHKDTNSKTEYDLPKLEEGWE